MATCQYLNDYNNMYWLMVHVHQIGTYVTQLLEYESNKCNELLSTKVTNATCYKSARVRLRYKSHNGVT